MLILTALLILSLTYIYVVHPIVRYNQAKITQDYNHALLCVKLRAIRRHYPELRKLSYHEIREKYQVDRFYDDIGR